jgi:hypothetical protein
VKDLKRRAVSVLLSVIAIGVVFAAAQVSSGGIGTWIPGVASWSDHVHGWRWVVHTVGGRDYPTIESSDDGGRSWHAIYRSIKPGTVRAVQPTSPSAGLAALSTIVGSRTSNRMIVTFTDGKAWHQLPAGEFWPYLSGSGSALFVLDNPNRSTSIPTTLYRVLPWPSLTPRVRPEATVTPGFYSFDTNSLTLIPGGVAALEIAGDSNVPFGLLVDRNGAKRFSYPPPVSNTGSVWCGVRSFSVDWPQVTVVTVWAARTGVDSCAGSTQPVVYQSLDYGMTWHTSGSPPTVTPPTTTSP